MLKTNRYLFIFAGITVALSYLILVVSRKFIPLLVRHTVYYCQTLVKSFSMRLPDNLGLILVGFLLLLAIFSLAKFIFTFIKIYYIKRNLALIVKTPFWFDKLSIDLNLKNKVFLVKSNKPFAFCYGLIDPKIYISTKLLDMTTKEELLAILVHEKYHLTSKDTLTLILASAAKSIFFFFPIFSDLIRNYKIEREVRADQEAIKYIGNKGVLLSVLKKLLNYEPEFALDMVAQIAEYQTLEARINALGNKKISGKRLSLVKAVTSTLSALVLLGLLLTPVQGVEIYQPEKDQDVMMICLEDKSCSMWCKENNAILPLTPLTP